jgi:DNA polymerase elongation subunit (family B)
MRERDPGSAPQIGDRVQYVFVQKPVVSFAEAAHRTMVNKKAAQKKQPPVQSSVLAFFQGKDVKPSKRSAHSSSASASSSASTTAEPALVKLSKKPTLGDLVEHPQFVLENHLKVDYLKYVESQLLNPTLEVLKLFDAEHALDDLLENARRDQQKQQPITKFLKPIKPVKGQDAPFEPSKES